MPTNPPPRPPARTKQSSHDSDRPLTPDDRELLLRRMADLEQRLRRDVTDLERRFETVEAVEKDVRELVADFREIATEVRDLSSEVRDAMARERTQDRQLWDLDARVKALASNAGEQAGDLSGREAARDVTKNTSAKTTLLAILIAAITSGVAQGLAEAFKPVRPVPVQQLPP